MSSGVALFERVLRSPEALWSFWLEHTNVVDPTQSGVVIATGRPEAEHLSRAKRTADAAGWEGLLADYWDFLARHDGVALDQGGDGDPRVEVVEPETLWEPLLWPARSANPDQLADFDVPIAASTLCFGELVGSGYLFFRKSRVGFLRKVHVDVWFFDFKESQAPTTRLASSFDDFLVRLSQRGLRVEELLGEGGAKGWGSDVPLPDFLPAG